MWFEKALVFWMLKELPHTKVCGFCQVPWHNKESRRLKFDPETEEDYRSLQVLNDTFLDKGRRSCIVRLGKCTIDNRRITGLEYRVVERKK